MKKNLSALLAVVILMSVSFAYAEDLGVQIIGGEQNTNKEGSVLSLDDLQLNAIYTVDNNAIAVPLEFLTVDCFAQFNKDEGEHIYTRPGSGWNTEKSSAIVYSHANCEFDDGEWRYANAAWQDSGDGAQFAWFRMDITNTNSELTNLTEKLAVKVTYRDEFEFAGWIRQIDYKKISKDYSNGLARYGFSVNTHPSQIVVHPENKTSVNFMETGNYVFGCTLPNYVVEDKESDLRMEVSIGETVLTYNIRK